MFFPTKSQNPLVWLAPEVKNAVSVLTVFIRDRDREGGGDFKSRLRQEIAILTSSQIFLLKASKISTSCPPGYRLYTTPPSLPQVPPRRNGKFSYPKGGIYHVLFRLLYRLYGFAVLESKQSLNGFLGLSKHDRTIIFLVILLDKTVSV